MSKILMVDDDAGTRELLREFLKFNSKAEVFEADNGKDAYKIATAHTIDLFLIDLDMQGMSGQELIKMIRGLAIYQYQPILVVSGCTDITNKVASKAAGATGFIVKPINFKTLAAYITSSMEIWYDDGKGHRKKEK